MGEDKTEWLMGKEKAPGMELCKYRVVRGVWEWAEGVCLGSRGGSCGAGCETVFIVGDACRRLPDEAPATAAPHRGKVWLSMGICSQALA
jgi:hypothetical protein